MGTRLPPEMWAGICAFLDIMSLKSMRLVDRERRFVSTPELFREVVLFIHPESLRKLQNIASTNEIRMYVQSILYYSDMFRDLTINEYEEDLDQQLESSDLQQHYKSYLRYYQAQTDLINADQDYIYLQSSLDHLPALRQVRTLSTSDRIEIEFPARVIDQILIPPKASNIEESRKRRPGYRTLSAVLLAARRSETFLDLVSADDVCISFLRLCSDCLAENIDALTRVTYLNLTFTCDTRVGTVECNGFKTLLKALQCLRTLKICFHTNEPLNDIFGDACLPSLQHFALDTTFLDQKPLRDFLGRSAPTLEGLELYLDWPPLLWHSFSTILRSEFSLKFVRFGAYFMDIDESELSKAATSAKS